MADSWGPRVVCTTSNSRTRMLWPVCEENAVRWNLAKITCLAPNALHIPRPHASQASTPQTRSRWRGSKREISGKSVGAWKEHEDLWVLFTWHMLSSHEIVWLKAYSFGPDSLVTPSFARGRSNKGCARPRLHSHGP